MGTTPARPVSASVDDFSKTVTMPTGTIATFYSYKGGVGRTFALANAAVALAGWGYRVLCIDWDLEAPGLHNYLKVEETKSGLVELITSVRDGQQPAWRDHITPASPGTVSLDLLAAGRNDSEYVDRLQKIDWEDLYEKSRWRLCWRSGETIGSRATTSF